MPDEIDVAIQQYALSFLIANLEGDILDDLNRKTGRRSPISFWEKRINELMAEKGTGQ